MKPQQLSVPQFFNLKTVGDVWRVPYNERAAQAEEWAKKYNIRPAATDKIRICLMPIDAQNTFCISGFELFVSGAVDDNVRLINFIYRYLGILTEIDPTMDTHTAMQIFHSIFWIAGDDFVDSAINVHYKKGDHPVGNATAISFDDVKSGKWVVNPAVAHSLADGNYSGLSRHALHYSQRLTDGGKYPLMVWGYHAMLGGIGHALVSAVEEACFFHNIARRSQTGFEIKGGNPLTENYSVLRPEVLDGPNGEPIAEKNHDFIKKLLNFDVVIIAGQAKSHCVAWTIDDLLNEIATQDKNLAKKVYILEDCTSPVIVPGIVDFTQQANDAFKRFSDAGMHVVKSTDPIEDWPGIPL